jgi:maltose O-acetyltransferase
MRSEMEKMLAGEPYRPDAPDLQAAQALAAAWMARYNAPQIRTPAAAFELLCEGLGEVGEGSLVRAPFRCDYGRHIHLGRGVFLNFGCVILDVARVHIGDRTQIGPAVQIYAADHPRGAAARRDGWELGRPVRIGADVWIGGGAIVLPGVSIGAGALVGAGAVVTRDVPPGATVAGNPARALRGGATA